jgi:23S rRNA pseudouridine1911/1915/1917 synthase
MPDLIREALGKPHLKVRAVHRLDQVVGGLMVYGLTGPAASELSRQIREDTFLKEYQAVVHWRPQYDEGTFTDLLGRDEKTRKTYVTKIPAKGVQEAVLHYRLLDNRQGFSLVEIRLETGRTHQIRAQFSHRGLPLLGDIRYGSRAAHGPALFSCLLAFDHPATGERMQFELLPQGEPWDLFQTTSP